MLYGVLKDWKMSVVGICYSKENSPLERGLLTDLVLEKAGNVAMFM
tara:strand:+ start:434 stop:571 length:138 start_codon:yes stop_codon:yes gene_type:complete